MNDLESIQGIGPKTAELLGKLHIHNQNDLIRFYPYRYDILKRSDITNLEDGSKVVIDGVVEGSPTIIYLNRGLKKMIFRISNKKTILNISIYNQVYLYDELKSGKDITIIGKYDKVKNTIVACEVRFEKLPIEPKIEAVYHSTSGLSSKNISKFISSAFLNKEKENDILPTSIIEKYNLFNINDALYQVHFPSDILSLKKARQRLKYEELFMYLLKINYMKLKINNDKKAISRNISQDKINEFINKLPFKLTIDQLKAEEDIIKDLNSTKRMNRLLQGDVGSGKTVIAFIASYGNFLAGYQTAMMVPTEILANQHYLNAQELFKDEKMNIELLTSSTSKKKKEEIYEKLESGEIDLIIGTQSLIQEQIKYKNLGLVITDEQHRFGVNQRDTFKNKGETPDILSMSATPIPRTYALTIYGDMDVSSIKTKPVGRKEVITYFKKEKDMYDILNLMKEELDKGHQIYVIAPSIDEDSDEKESVTDLEEKMKKAFGKICKIGSVHGKMDSKDKSNVMTDFEKKKIDILISTTVIEVGVNVPNASMIVIFNANLFGLSTLHQLRGRVGRGDIQSYCILIAKEYQERLKMLERCNDGFEISEYDFQNRGEGDLFGIRQSGETGLVLANVNRDFKMMLKAKEDADYYINEILNDETGLYDSVKQELMKTEYLD